MRYFIFLLIFISGYSSAQDRTVGLTYYSAEVSDGYTLITSHSSTSTFLIDNCGNVVHEWTSNYDYGNSVELLENGLLLRSTKVASGFLNAGGAGGRIELLDWDSNVVWEGTYATNEYRHHHDALSLPNGNILILAWDSRSMEDALNAGIKPENLGSVREDVWGEHLIELAPLGNNSYEIVWEWYLWDHLVQDYDDSKLNYGVVSEHPELVDLNYNVDPGNPDWIHANAIDYNADLDQILVNSRNFSEFWIIDHSTTMEEARSHTGGLYGRGGDLLYRFGNPQIYQRGGSDDQVLFGQHNPHWIGRDKIILFNNGRGREESFSEILFLKMPVNSDGTYSMNEVGTFGPETPYLSFSSNEIDGFNFSPFISGVDLIGEDRLLICSGPSGTVSEINLDGERLWTYISPLSSQGIIVQGEKSLSEQNVTNLMYRSAKYTPEFPGLDGKTLDPGLPIELEPLPSLCDLITSTAYDVINDLEKLHPYPNPFDNFLHIHSEGIISPIEVWLYTLDGHLVYQNFSYEIDQPLSFGHLSRGTYILKTRTVNDVSFRKVMKN